MMTLSRNPAAARAWRERSRPLGRNVPLLPGQPRRASLTVVRDIGSGETKPAPKRKPAREPEDMPNDYIPAAVRELVLERDSYCCVCCGRSIIGQRYSLGHRLRASQGGKPVASNLETLLGWGGESHHGRIDSRRDPRDEDNGYTVKSGNDPAAIPVVVVSEHGSMCVWLDDAGAYLDYPPDDGGSAA
jgi:hypothetical protein